MGTFNVFQRKKLLHEDGEKKGDGKISEDKIKQLRKRNSELTSLCKELEDKVKTLKADMEQLVHILDTGVREVAAIWKGEHSL